MWEMSVPFWLDIFPLALACVWEAFLAQAIPLQWSKHLAHICHPKQQMQPMNGRCVYVCICRAELADLCVSTSACRLCVSVWVCTALHCRVCVCGGGRGKRSFLFVLRYSPPS